MEIAEVTAAPLLTLLLPVSPSSKFGFGKNRLTRIAVILAHPLARGLRLLRPFEVAGIHEKWTINNKRKGFSFALHDMVKFERYM